MRDTRITLLPEQKDFLPLTCTWKDIKNTSKLDISQCKGVESCGLAASVLNIHHLFNDLHPENPIIDAETEDANESEQYTLLPEIAPKDSRQTHSKKHEPFIINFFKNSDTVINTMFSQLGFFDAIRNRLSDELQKQHCGSKTTPVVHSSFSRRVKSMPLCHLNFNEQTNQRRDVLQKMFEYVEPVFDSVFLRDHDKGNQLTHVLEEIVKNSADHSNADGFIGIDVIQSETKTKLNILIGDLGPGIYKHIKKKFFDHNPTRKGKGSFAEGYKLALTNEISSSSSDENYGCGMSSIVNNSLALGANISVFDNESRLILSSLNPIDSKAPSHNEIWRSSFRFVSKIPFFYFIECEELL